MDHKGLIKKSPGHTELWYFSVNVTATARVRRVPVDGALNTVVPRVCTHRVNQKISPDGLIFVADTEPAASEREHVFSHSSS